MTRYTALMTVRSPLMTDGFDIGSGKITCCSERNPADSAVGRSWRRRRARMHRPSSPPKEKASAHLEAGAKKVLVSAPASGADFTRGLWRQPRPARRRSWRRLQRVLHHQLPGAGRQGAERLCGIERGYMTTIHAYTSISVCSTPTMPTRAVRAPQPVDDPDLDRRRQGRRPGVARACRQARRHGDPRADPQRVAGRPGVRAWP